MLGAGGVLGGAWLVGGLSALAQHTGWDPAEADIVVGTSAGSMVGALLAAGVPPWFMVAHSAGEHFPGLRDAAGRPTDDADRSAGGVLRLRRAWPDPRPGSLGLAVAALRSPGRFRVGAALAGWAPNGPMSTRPLRETVHAVVPDGWVDHPNLWVVATDYSTGRRVCLGRAGSPPADLASAVAASCAIPGVYRPVRIGDRRFVDGGAYSTSNLDVVRGQGLDLVICLNPLSSREEELAAARRTGWRGGLRRGAGRRLGWEARRLRSEDTRVVLLQPLAEDLAAMGGNLMSTRRRHQVLELAQRTVAWQLSRQELPGGLPAAPEHRLRRPAGPVSGWPADLLPGLASVGP